MNNKDNNSIKLRSNVKFDKISENSNLDWISVELELFVTEEKSLNENHEVLNQVLDQLKQLSFIKIAGKDIHITADDTELEEIMEQIVLAFNKNNFKVCFSHYRNKIFQQKQPKFSNWLNAVT